MRLCVRLSKYNHVLTVVCFWERMICESANLVRKWRLKCKTADIELNKRIEDANPNPNTKPKPKPSSYYFREFRTFAYYNHTALCLVQPGLPMPNKQQHIEVDHLTIQPPRAIPYAYVCTQTSANAIRHGL